MAEPAKFRPITVSSVMVRAYTRILAWRAADLCPLRPVQRAFISADGTAENTALLEVLLTAVSERQPLAIAWLDVAKAFDSVVHPTILRCAERAGLPPPPAVAIIADLYHGATTELRR